MGRSSVFQLPMSALAILPQSIEKVLFGLISEGKHQLGWYTNQPYSGEVGWILILLRLQ